MDTLAERVGAGARWLDEHVPGWEHRIDLAKLDLKDTCLCVLGQVFEEQAAAAYYTGDERYYPSVRGGHHGFWFTTDMEWDSYAQTCEHGFGITGEDAGGDTVAAWHELQAAWVALLKARFDSGTLSDVEQTA